MKKRYHVCGAIYRHGCGTGSYYFGEMLLTEKEAVSLQEAGVRVEEAVA